MYRVTILAVLHAGLLAGAAPIMVGGQRIEPGTARSFDVRIDDATVPVTVVNGTNPGPKLALTAGIHGYEYPPILALQRVLGKLNPREISGAVLMVHVANMPSFLERTISRGPIDGKNLNRVFPGKPDGTISEKIAHFITTGIIEQSDYLLDLHAGDGHEALWPHVYQNFIGEPVVDRGTELLARASGFAHIVLYGDRPRDPARSISCQNTAITRGKPALTIESGGLGGRDDESVERILGAIDNIMRYLKMIAGEPRKPESSNTFESLLGSLRRRSHNHSETWAH